MSKAHRPVLRRLTVVLAATTITTALSVGGAAAFEPPADPAGNFGCDPTAVLGHPGAAGQSVAFGNGAAGTGAAWSAHVNSGMIGNCIEP